MDVEQSNRRARSGNKIDRLWLLILALLAAIPFRDGFIHGDVVGAGPDVISTLWGMWWLQQGRYWRCIRYRNILVNFPYGATGIVLSPTSAIMWGLLEPIFGVGMALALTNWFQITGIAWGMVWLAKSVVSPVRGMVWLDCRCCVPVIYSLVQVRRRLLLLWRWRCRWDWLAG